MLRSFSKQQLREKFLSILFRFLTLVIKMAFIFYIGKEMPSEALGQYGIITTTLTFLTIFIGFDLYIEVQRKILDRPTKVKSIFVNHITSLLLNYVIVLPIIISVNFWFGFYNSLFLFFLVLFGEHFGLEFFRFLIIKGHSKWANIYIFCKDILWIFLLLIKWFFLGVSDVFLDEVLLFWGGGASFIFLIAFGVFLYHFKDETFKFSFGEVKGNYKIGIKYIYGSIAVKTLQYSDRYILLFFLSMKDLGVYTFFNQLSNSINSLVFALTVSFAYPKIIELSSNDDESGFSLKKRNFNKELIVVFGLAILGTILILPYLLDYIGKSDFKEYHFLMYFLLVGNLIFNFSFPYHFGLIGKREDNVLNWLNIGGAIISLGISVLGIFLYGIIGGGVAKVLSFGVIYFMKKIMFKRICKK